MLSGHRKVLLQPGARANQVLSEMQAAMMQTDMMELLEEVTDDQAAGVVRLRIRHTPSKTRCTCAIYSRDMSTLHLQGSGAASAAAQEAAAQWQRSGERIPNAAALTMPGGGLSVERTPKRRQVSDLFVAASPFTPVPTLTFPRKMVTVIDDTFQTTQWEVASLDASAPWRTKITGTNPTDQPSSIMMLQPWTCDMSTSTAVAGRHVEF